MNALVICPLKKELTIFLNTVRKFEYEIIPIKASDRAVYKVPKLEMIATTGGHGKVDMALSTQKMLLDYPEVKTVICLGTAGALGPPANAHDVVVASSVVEHDYKSHFNNEDSKRPEFDTCIAESDIQALTVSHQGGFHIFFEPIASGDEDIVSKERAEELRSSTQALAVAWEGAGAARACKRHNKNFCEIRGLSDSADSQTSFSFAKNLPKAIANATEVVLQLFGTRS